MTKTKKSKRKPSPKMSEVVTIDELEAGLARRRHRSSGCAFGATTLGALRRVATDLPSIPTMAVAFVGAVPTLFYNPRGCGQMEGGEEEFDATIDHEILHLELHHIARGEILRRRFDFEGCDPTEKRLQLSAHNIAADYAANCILVQNGGRPRIGYPSHPLGYWAFPEQRGLPRGESYEWYFKKVLEQMRTALAKAQCKDGGSEAGDGSAGVVYVSGDEAASVEMMIAVYELVAETMKADAVEAAEAAELEKAAEDAAGKPRVVVPAVPAPESLPPPEELPDLATLQGLCAAVTIATKSEFRATGRSIPGLFGKVTLAIDATPLPGLEQLHNAMRECGAGGSSNTDLTISGRALNQCAVAQTRHYAGLGSAYASLAARTPLVPGMAFVDAPAQNWALVLDTSGSMTGALLTYGIKVCRDVYEELNVAEGVLLTADDRVTETFVLEPGCDFPSELTGCGGTEFDPGLRGAVEWAEKAGIHLDGIAYITDGCAAPPRYKAPCPVIWVGVGVACPVHGGSDNYLNVNLGDPT